jgi:hypothetical protein
MNKTRVDTRVFFGREIDRADLTGNNISDFPSVPSELDLDLAMRHAG